MEKNISIRIDKFRAIHRASIDLNGITVIAGINGSGKSTISKLLYSVFTRVEMLNQLYAASFFTEIQPILEIHNQTVDAYKPAGFSLFFAVSNADPKAFLESLSRLMNVTGDLLLNKDERSMRLLDIIKYNLKIEVKGKEDLNIIISKCQEAVRDYEKKISERPSGALINAVANEFSDAEIKDKVSVSEYGYEFFGNNAKNIPLIHSIHNTSYIATPMALEQFGGQLFLNQSEHHDSHINMDIYQRIANVMQGVAEFSKEQNRYFYKRNDGKTFLLFDSATGIKSFAFLQILLQGGFINDRSLIIIDEPEAHLHPQWIVEYAKVLVELNKQTKAKFFLATHSTDMVSALRYISEKENILDDLSFYQAISSKDDEFAFDYHYLGTDIEPIFESFNKSFELIEQYGEDNSNL